MKLYKFGFAALSSVMLTACEEPKQTVIEQAAPSEATTQEGGAPATSMSLPSPTDVCSALATAAKNKDEAKFLSMSTPATAEAWQAANMKERTLNIWSQSSCVVNSIEGEKAFLTLSHTQGKQSAQMMKTADGWKLDGPGFISTLSANTAATTQGMSAQQLEKKPGADKEVQKYSEKDSSAAPATTSGKHTKKHPPKAR